ncbi:MAG: PspC domain-containing protein [Ornithinimicrobium sp.]
MDSPQPPARPPLVRPVQGRVLAGVAAGLAAHLGVSVRVVRVVLLVMIGAGGSGLAVYLFLVALVPQADRVPTARSIESVRGRGDRPSGTPEVSEVPQRSGGVGVWFLAGGGLAVAVGLGLQWGVSLDTAFWLPVLLLTTGAVFVWAQLDGTARRAWAPQDPTRRRWTVARVVAGVAMAVIGLVLLATRGQGLADLWDVVVAVLVVLVGLTLVMTPLVARLWREFRLEQSGRIRATERADIAAHLHDSVLQTLTLIQRQSDDPNVIRLARGQERELRQWLFRGNDQAEATLASAVADMAHEVEDRHGVPVELVVTGDAPLDARTAALVAALREAMVNAVSHARPPISTYLEVGPRQIEAFVRDRGAGFDLELVPTDRQGIRESIIGRMQRHGGQAQVRPMSDGTEIALTMSLPDTAPHSTASTGPPPNGVHDDR